MSIGSGTYKFEMADKICRIGTRVESDGRILGNMSFSQ